MHEDPRVRCEAIRLQLKLPHERDQAIVHALEDLDPRVVHLGLTALQFAVPEELLPRVLNLAVDADLDDDIRTLAVKVAGKVQRFPVLDMLLELTDGGRSLLGRFRLPVKTPVLLAALRALADTWSDQRSRRGRPDGRARISRSRYPGCRVGSSLMSDPVRFLNAFAQALGVMTLYPDGHPSRERAVDAAFDELDGLWGPVGHSVVHVSRR